MANTQCPIFQCFRDEIYPLAIFRKYNLINELEEGMIMFKKLEIGAYNLMGIPFFGSDRPEVFIPFSLARNEGLLRHFHEFRMFQIMDMLYFPMRMKILQSHTLDLTQRAQISQWERLSRSLDKRCKTFIGDKELSVVFAISQCLKNIRTYLDGHPNSVDSEKLSAEYKLIADKFEKQMDGLPEYYYMNIIVDYPKFCAHSDTEFSQKSVDLVLDTTDCFDIKPGWGLTESEKDERILNLAHLAKRALFFNPCFTNSTRKKIFDPSFEFPKRIKRAYHEREKERAASKNQNEGRGPYGS